MSVVASAFNIVWSIAFVVEIYFKISLHTNSVIQKIIKWVLFNSKHLLFFEENEHQEKSSQFILKKMINQKKINKILLKAAAKYKITIEDIKGQILYNHKTSHHYNDCKNCEKKTKLANDTLSEQLLNYNNKKLLKEYKESNRFYKVISHKIH